MSRLARIVLPHIPHHVTQRGNGRAQTFFCDDDYRSYRNLLVEHCQRHGVSVWGWCLMPNHVHLVLTPSDTDGLRGALSRLHRMYAGRIHARERRSGHFWQGRFGCVAMDDEHLIAALAYVALNPVRAGLVERAEDWAWSSAHAYRPGIRGDGVIDRQAVVPFLRPVRKLIAAGQEDERFKALRKSETIGRPIGDDTFMRQAEEQTGRTLRPGKRGPKPR